MPESVVALSVQLDNIYWVRMTRGRVVSDWNYFEMGNYLHRSYDHVTHIKKV